jgi:DNA mismatch repair protein MSH5
LLTAALKKFASINSAVVCTTHFLEMFSQGLLRDGENGLKALHMAVHVPREQDEMAAPLFKLEEGVADSSAGIICARKAGLNRQVVGRANEIVQVLKHGQTLQPSEEVLKAIAARILTPVAKDALRDFLSVKSWADATDEQIQMLLQKIAKL